MWSGHDCGDVGELRGNDLLSLPVRLHGIDLGRPVDLLLDREALRALGLDVLCGDEVHRFLPLPTVAVGAEALTIHSPLVLLEEDELDFYRSRAFALSSARTSIVHTREASSDSNAAWYPDPVPTSSTRSLGRSSSASSIRATTTGCEIVCPPPIGSATFSYARARNSSGTKRSRGIDATAASTR